MPGIWLRIQIRQVFNQFDTQWIEANAAHQFQQVGVFLSLNGFAAVLKQLNAPQIPAVVRGPVIRQQSTHRGGHWHIACSQQ